MFLVQITGIIIAIVGFIFLVMGYSTSEAMVHQVTAPRIDRYFDETVWYLILGITGVISGSILMMLDHRN